MLNEKLGNMHPFSVRLIRFHPNAFLSVQFLAMHVKMRSVCIFLFSNCGGQLHLHINISRPSVYFLCRHQIKRPCQSELSFGKGRDTGEDEETLRKIKREEDGEKDERKSTECISYCAQDRISIMSLCYSTEIRNWLNWLRSNRDTSSVVIKLNLHNNTIVV